MGRMGRGIKRLELSILFECTILLIIAFHAINNSDVIGLWCERKILCVDMSRGLHSQFLLEDCHLCIPCHVSSHRNNAGISDKKSAASRSEGL